jgi:tartrate dehydratase beta subunit/fumarate hydratase class I family protein
VRKLILIAAFALASVSAQAAERIDRVPADIDAPVAAAAPVAAPPAAPSAAVEPQTSGKQTSSNQAYSNQTYRKQAATAQAYRSRTTLRATQEQKARRIAAAYGISW